MSSRSAANLRLEAPLRRSRIGHEFAQRTAPGLATRVAPAVGAPAVEPAVRALGAELEFERADPPPDGMRRQVLAAAFTAGSELQRGGPPSEAAEQDQRQAGRRHLAVKGDGPLASHTAVGQAPLTSARAYGCVQSDIDLALERETEDTIAVSVDQASKPRSLLLKSPVDSPASKAPPHPPCARCIGEPDTGRHLGSAG